MKLVALLFFLMAWIVAAGEPEERITFILKTLESSHNSGDELASIPKLFHESAVIRTIYLSDEGEVPKWIKRCITRQEYAQEIQEEKEVAKAQGDKISPVSYKLVSSAIAKDGKSGVLEVTSSHSWFDQKGNVDAKTQTVMLETFYLSTGPDGLKILAWDLRLPEAAPAPKE